MRKCFQKNANILLKKKIPKYIIDDIEIFFESDKENSDDDNSDKENSDEEILAKIQIKENSDEEDSSEEDFSEENSDEKNQFFFYIYRYYQNPLDYRRSYYLAHKSN